MAQVTMRFSLDQTNLIREILEDERKRLKEFINSPSGSPQEKQAARQRWAQVDAALKEFS